MNNEGSVSPSRKNRLKTVMIRQLERLGRSDVRTWERATFQAVTGQTVEDIDFELRGNRAGYQHWMSSFELLWQELEEDGYVKITGKDPAGAPVVEARESDQPFGWS